MGKEELKRELAAAVAYNRFMEKRVAFLENELRVAQHQGQCRPALPMPEKEPQSLPEYSPSSDTPNLETLLTENKKLSSQLKKMKKELSTTQQDLKIAQVNLEHITTRDKNNMKTIQQMGTELAELKSVLPSSFFASYQKAMDLDLGAQAVHSDNEEDAPDAEIEIQHKVDPFAAAYSANDGKQLFESLSPLFDPLKDVVETKRLEQLFSLPGRVRRILYFCDPNAGIVSECDPPDVLSSCEEPFLQPRTRKDMGLFLMSVVIEHLDNMPLSIDNAAKQLSTLQRAHRLALNYVFECQGLNDRSSSKLACERVEETLKTLNNQRNQARCAIDELRKEVSRVAAAMIECSHAALGLTMRKSHIHAPLLIEELEKAVEKFLTLDLCLIPQDATEISALEKHLQLCCIPQNAPPLNLTLLKTMSEENKSLAVDSTATRMAQDQVRRIRLCLSNLKRLLNGELDFESISGLDARLNNKATQVNFTQAVSDEHIRLSQLARKPWFRAVQVQLNSTDKNQPEEQKQERDEEIQDATGQEKAFADSKPRGKRDAAKSPYRYVYANGLPQIPSLLESYRKNGVQFPPNFSPVDVAPDSHQRHQKYALYNFGTRTIAISVVGGHLAAQIGGGYLFLDEYCARHTESETFKLVRQKQMGHIIKRRFQRSKSASRPLGHYSPFLE